MNTSFHVLVVDDDQQIRNGLSRLLRDNGFRVSLASDGLQLMSAMKDAKIDLVLLDVMLPGVDGLELCRRLRTSHDIPVIMLTAMTANADRVTGLELGADDYICKPFDPHELVARIKSVLRRSNALPVGGRKQAGAVYLFDNWSLDIVKRMLTSPSGALVDLTTGEFDLLQAFVEYPQRILTRDQLLDIARGRSSVLFDRSIDVQVSRLRRKIEADPQRPLMIKTVRGGGYLFTPEVASR